MDWDEQIKAHLVWIWGQEEGFMKRGKEGMLVITDRRIAFITKTNMSYRVHDIHSLRQLKKFKEGGNIFKPLEGYGIKNLDITSEDKRWGTLLKIKINLGVKSKIHKFSIVKGWVKYPLKDPVEFQHVNWFSVINLFKESK